MFAFAVCGSHASAQAPRKVVVNVSKLSEEEFQLMEFKFALTAFMPTFPKDITAAKRRKIEEKIKEIILLQNKEFQEKFGDLDNSSGDRQGEVSEFMAASGHKVYEATWNFIRETLPAETVEEMEILTFQQSGGVFGGTRFVENLAPLRLTAEQKENVEKIIEKLFPEYFELLVSLDMMEPDLEAVRETLEKMVSLLRGGQQEIEAILTDEQKQRAEELMADVPEGIRFLSDYLKNHP